MTLKDRQWRGWTTEDWNEAIFKHFFLDSDGEDRPVRRIPVTGDELLKVVGDTDSTTEDVQNAFLAIIRTTSPKKYNYRLSQYKTDPRVGWRGNGIPPFFIELIFSCYVATPPDEEKREEGDYRKRLALLMDHEQTMTNYPLETLSQLWEAFSQWLDTKRSAGSPYRRLELPPKDYRVRIGYSINLAFPSRKDLKNLISILTAAGLTADPPIPTVFTLVGNAINSFSNGFRRAYDEFREAYRSRNTDLDQYPFWGAIRESLDCMEEIRPSADGEDTALKLLMDYNGEILLLSNSPREVVKGKLSFVEADALDGEFQNVLCLGSDFEHGIHKAMERLLQGQYWEHINDRGCSLIRIAIKQGILIFTKNERSEWELVFTLQEEGDCQAIVNNSIAPILLSAFPQDRRPNHRVSRYLGWNEFDCFPGEWLISLQYDNLSLLANIHCLQPTIRRAKLYLVGGCPIDGGYLGIPDCLPSVRAPMSTKVDLIPSETKQSCETLHLARQSPDSVDFTFPSEFETHLEGRFYFVGIRDERVLVRKEVVFRPDIVVNDYARPTNLDAWLVESGGPDVVTFGELSKMEQANNDQPAKKVVIGCSGGTLFNKFSMQSPTSIGVRFRRQCAPFIPPGCNTHWSSNDVKRATKLMEICGGLAMRRRGIPEGEFVDLLQKILLVDRYHKWDVVRAWIEVGYVDRLMFRNWQRTEYFPRIPRLILDRVGSNVKGALSGLTTSALRNRVDVYLQEMGASRIETLSSSEWVPPVPMWVAPDTKVFEKVSTSLALEEPTWVQPITDALWTLKRIASSNEDAPRFYDCWGCWDREKGWFERDKRPTGRGIEVARFLHVERPPLYQVLEDGQHVWWSTSRNWALLLAHDLIGVQCFRLTGSDQLVRSINGKVYLPLPIGRYLAATCPVSSGPVGDQQCSYYYQFRDSLERSCIVASVWGGNTIPIKELRRWGRWMLDMSMRPSYNFDGRTICLPTSVKEILCLFPDVPEFQELSRIRINPSLLPRLRNGLSRFTKSLQGDCDV